MSTQAERAQRRWFPKWRVSINGEVFEARHRLPTDALTSAMRKYLAGPRRRMADGVECWERHSPPPENSECRGIVTGKRGEQIWLVPIVPTADRPRVVASWSSSSPIYITSTQSRRRQFEIANQRDPKSGAQPHAVHSDYSIFVERVPEEPGSPADRYFKARDEAASRGLLGVAFGVDDKGDPL